MATVEHVYQEVVEELDGDASFGINRFLRLVNRCMNEVANGVFPEYPEIPEIYLPTLETSSTVAATSTTYTVSMPTNYLKRLVNAHSHNRDGHIVILRSFDQLQAKDPGLDTTGCIYWCTVVGTSLCYTNKADDTLTLRYIKKPTELKPGDTISELPDGMSIDLLKNYVLMKLPVVYKKKLSYNPEDEFKKALMRLSRFYGTYSPEAKGIRDVTFMNYD